MRGLHVPKIFESPCIMRPILVAQVIRDNVIGVQKNLLSVTFTQVQNYVLLRFKKKVVSASYFQRSKRPQLYLFIFTAAVVFNFPTLRPLFLMIL